MKWNTIVDNEKKNPNPNMELTTSSNNTLGLTVECYKDKRTGKEYRKPFELMKGIHVLDALAATGLRSVRYLKEIPGKYFFMLCLCLCLCLCLMFLCLLMFNSNPRFSLTIHIYIHICVALRCSQGDHK
jgi:hypothetical protein